MRWWFLLCLLVAVCTFIRPPAAFADVEYGLVQGTVKYTDNLPCGSVAFTVKVGATTVPLTTDHEGKFSGVVPVGQAVFTVNGVKTNKTITPGEVNQINLTASRPGWTFSFFYPDKKPANIESVIVEYKTSASLAEAKKRAKNRRHYGSSAPGCIRLYSSMIAQGRYWLPKIPSDTLALALVATSNENGVQIPVRQRWAFTDKRGNRTFTISVPRSPQVSLRIVDAGGNPIADSAISGSLTFAQYVNVGAHCWDDKPFATNAIKLNLPKRQTDAQGVLNLGALPPRQYTLSLMDDDHAGSPVSFTVAGTGTPLKQYAMKLAMRTVTQTVFGADGKAAANARVLASYYWRGVAHLVEEQSDAAGKIVWKDLPPVKVITWGSAVSPGVIAPESTVITAPLPAPMAKGWMNYRFKYANPEGNHDRVYGFVRGINTNMYLRNYYTRDGGEVVNNGQQSEWPCRIPCGTPFMLQMVSHSSPPRVLSLTNIYVPYVETNDQVEFPLVLQEGATIRGRFVSADGKAIPGLSRLQVSLVKIADTPGYGGVTNREFIRAIQRFGYDYGEMVPQLEKLVQPVWHADGTFTMDILSPGTYRLLPDLFDDATALPEFQVTVKPGINDVAITLPEPIASVPGGTVINWLTANAPAQPRRMAAAAFAPNVPVYGPKDLLPTYWYRPSTDKLVLCDMPEGKPRTRTFALRSMFVSLLGKDNKTLRQGATLYPLLPGTSPLQNRYVDYPESYHYRMYGNPYRQVNDGNNDSSLPVASESMPTFLQPPIQEVRLDLWAGGSYLVLGASPMAQVDVPAEGTPVIEAQISVDFRNPHDRQGKEIRIAFPAIKDANVKKTAARGANIFYDVPMQDEYQGFIWNPQQQRENWVHAPLRARSFSIQWLGVGVIRNIAIPDAVPNAGPSLIQLPSWKPGAIVAGKVVKADGKPYANSPISITIPGFNNGEQLMQLKTDADGKFSIKGLLPGPIFIWHSLTGTGWSLEVPENGLSNVVLRISPQAVRIDISNMNEGRSQVWWIPDGGKAKRLPSRWSQCAAHDAQPGPGVLWGIDGMTGRGFYLRCVLTPGNNNVSWTTNSGPSLGITFPLDLTAGLPGSITIIGQGECAGITVKIGMPSWVPSAALGTVSGQLDAVPPGTYKLVVDTPRGPVKATVTVTEAGGAVKLAYPAVKEKKGEDEGK